MVVIVAQKRRRVEEYVDDEALALTVLVDEQREAAKAYGVWHRFGLDAMNIARPALFSIDASRTITSIYVAESQGEFPAHEEILAVLDQRR